MDIHTTTPESGKAETPPGGLTSRNLKKIKRMSYGIRKGRIIIDFDEYSAVRFCKELHFEEDASQED